MGEKGSILLFGFGSRGDVQPLVCVGERMQDSGWNVRVLCTWPDELILSTFGRDCPIPVCSIAGAITPFERPASSTILTSLRRRARDLVRFYLYRLPVLASSWLPNCLQLSAGNWEEALSRDLWAPLGARLPPRRRGMLLWHYDMQPALFTVPVWRAVGSLVRDARVVVVSEGSDQPALEMLVLAVCAFHGVTVVPLACFPREPLLNTRSPSWLLASLLPGLYERSFRWWPVVQHMAFYLSHIVAYVLMWVLQWLQAHSAWCYSLCREEEAHTDFRTLVNEAAARDAALAPVTWTELAQKARYTPIVDPECRFGIQAYSRAMLTSSALLPPPAATLGQGAIFARPDAFSAKMTELERFLQQDGLPFVYFGHVCSGELLQGCCLDVVDKLECRGVFGFQISPQTMYDPRYMELYCQGRLYTLQGSMPQHTWLFRHIHVAIHHAGAGTTQAALSCGVPSVTLPHWGDQFYWAAVVHQLHAGAPPVPLLSITSAATSGVGDACAVLRARVQQCLGDKGLRDGARQVALRMRGEDGVGSVVRVVTGLAER